MPSRERLLWIQAFAVAEMRELESAGDFPRAMNQLRIYTHAEKILQSAGEE